MTRFEEERAVAAKITQARAAEDAKAIEANRAVMTDTYAAIAEGETKRRVQRRADFTKGEYSSLDELLAAARKM